MDSQCMMNNCRAMCPDTEPFCAKHRGEPHGRSDWFAGDVDCDGNELITVRKDEWNTICEQREKFMWQVRDTCTRAENAEAHIAALQAEVARYREALERIERWFGEFPETGKTWPCGAPMSYAACFGINGERDYMRDIARQALKGTDNAE